MKLLRYQNPAFYMLNIFTSVHFNTAMNLTVRITKYIDETLHVEHNPENWLQQMITCISLI